MKRPETPPTKAVWIGGPAAAGKTMVSRLLARRHGLRWYSVDAHTFQHEDRAVAAGAHVRGTGPGSYDRGPMIAEDVRSLPAVPLVVVEGAQLSPDAVPTARALWLMPSQGEQRRRLELRHPEGVHEGFLLGWQRIAGQLDGTPMPTMAVDGQNVTQTLEAVEQVFAGPLAAGPLAQATEERRALIRYGNGVLARHAATGLHRGMLRGTDPVIRTFDCECADRACEAFVQLPLTEALEGLEQPAPSRFVSDHDPSRSLVEP